MALHRDAVEHDAEVLLREWLAGSLRAVKRTRHGKGPDLVLDTPNAKLAVEIKASVASTTVSGAIEQVRAHAADLRGHVVPVVAVPFMTDLGKRLSERSTSMSGLPWLCSTGTGTRSWPEGCGRRISRPT
jgi:hypothetical protein